MKAALAAILTCAALTACVTTSQTGSSSASNAAIPDTSSIGQSLNAYRASNGLGALTRNAALDRAAAGHAAYMAQTDTLSHTGSGGSNFSRRIRDTGYCFGGHGAENISGGYSSEAQAMQAWTNSPGHQRNLLNRNVTQYGYGVSGSYRVMVFANGC